MAASNPILPFLAARGALILDGGLATELEARGHDLSDALWSARLLLDDPGAIRWLHRDYLEAGADCVITASYQATLQGFADRGLPAATAEELLRRAVALALEARDEFLAEGSRREGRLRPLVAASVGPYGAFLADGSEYRGDYGVSETFLTDFHRRRWEVLATSGADLLACETLPSLVEARALLPLLAETPETWAWFSFSCRDGEHLSDGTPIEACARLLEGVARVAAIGVNCTAPRHIESLASRLRAVSSLPLVVYPNSGEVYDPATRRWQGERDAGEFAAACEIWQSAGATLIGGCCRTGPAHVRAIRHRLLDAAGRA